MKKGLQTTTVGKLEKLKSEVETLRLESTEMINEEKVRKRSRIRKMGLSPATGAKQFWRLVKLKNHPDSIIWAFKTKNGKLEIELGRMMNKIQEEVGDKFNATKEKVFESVDDQIKGIKEALVELGLKESSQDWSEEVLPKFTAEEVTKLIQGLKEGKAPGYDFITATMLKNAGDEVVYMLTDIYNSIIEEGKVPECLNQGIMNLIQKEKSSLTLKQRRPLTMSSIIIGIFTSRMSKMMAKVAERENHLSDASYGFREGRSTVDCIFLLNTVLQKAKKLKIPLTLASVDLKKAYDMVSREKLFAKLETLG